MELRLLGGIEPVMETAIETLRVGRSAEPSLWFATIVDIVTLYISLGREASEVAECMAAEGSAFSDAPWAIKQVAIANSRRSEMLRY